MLSDYGISQKTMIVFCDNTKCFKYIQEPYSSL